VRSLLARYDRAADYIEVSLTSPHRYNPCTTLFSEVLSGWTWHDTDDGVDTSTEFRTDAVDALGAAEIPHRIQDRGDAEHQLVALDVARRGVADAPAGAPDEDLPGLVR
jgi:hypothetical protein